MNDFLKGLDGSIENAPEEDKPANNEAFQEAFAGKAPDPNAERPEAVAALSELFNSVGRIKPPPPMVVGLRNMAHAANNLQFFRIPDTENIFFGTPLEYSADYGAPVALSALGCEPSLDVSGVETFGYECGAHVMGDYYVARGYTADNGWIFNAAGALEFVGVAAALKLFYGK